MGVRVLLVSMPLEALPAPSIQIGTLKALLDRAGISADTRHYKIDLVERCLAATAASPESERIGPAEYERLTDEGLAGGLAEWIFAGPPLRPPDPDLDRDYLDFLRAQGVAERDLALALRVRALVPEFLEACADDVLAARPGVVGFTSTFAQNLPSLALARVLKQREPTLPVVLGGAACDGPMGAALHRAFPWLDVVVRGEAERVLPGLVEELLAGRPVSPRPGLCYRDGAGRSVAIEQGEARVPMDEVPLPDYDEFFARVERASFYPAVVTRLRLPYEAARGCWWGERSHCTFCGLNGTAMAFRSKPPERVLDELTALVDRHEVLDLLVVDNIMDVRYLRELLPRLAGRGHDLSLFYEVKANLKREHVRLLGEAGVRHLQPGIESLSTPILALMRKGVTALQNLRLLTWCQEYGIRAHWNLLYGFPGEPAGEYERMADLCRSLVHLDPPRLTPLDVQRFSPYHDRPEAHGIVVRGPAPHYRYLYPDVDEATRAALAYSFDFAYADGRDPHAYVAGLRERIQEWTAAWQAGASRATLAYRRGPSFLRVVDRRPGLPGAHWTFDDQQARAFLACRDGVTARQALAALDPEAAADLGEGWAVEFLEGLVEERLAVREGDRYLTLALPQRHADADDA